MENNSQTILEAQQERLRQHKPLPTPQETSQTKVGPDLNTIGSDDQAISKTNQFFEKVRSIYGKAKYNSQFADKEDLARAKRTWSEEISKLTSAQYKLGFTQLKKHIQRGDEDWQWPNIGMIIGLCRKSERTHPAHKFFLPTKEFEKTPKLEKVGNAALAEMKKGLRV